MREFLLTKYVDIDVAITLCSDIYMCNHYDISDAMRHIIGEYINLDTKDTVCLVNYVLKEYPCEWYTNLKQQIAMIISQNRLETIEDYSDYINTSKTNGTRFFLIEELNREQKNYLKLTLKRL